MIGADPSVPRFCYDLLLENAELRQLANTYQIKVMLHLRQTLEKALMN